MEERNDSEQLVARREAAPVQELEPGGAEVASAPEQPGDDPGTNSEAPTLEAPAAEPALEAAAPVPDEVEDDEDLPLMERLLRSSTRPFRILKYGDVVEGTIMRRDRDEILVDIGSKSEGIIPNREISSLMPDEAERLTIGDDVLAFVIQAENSEGHVVLSIDRARTEKSWRRLQTQYETGEIIRAEVVGYNKGGLLVNLGGVRGFVPASQVTGISGGNEAAKQSEMARYVGQTLPLKVIEINRHRKRLILSERQALQQTRESQRERLMQELHEGQVRKGIVSSICDFGAFVDIGGADGLIHLSELSWSRVNHPSEVLKVGERIEVFVLNVDESEKKIGLSLKRTQPEPWTTVASKYVLGQLVRGTITQLASFGAFARIEDGIEGLIHVSELSEGRVIHPRNVVKEGDTLTLRIIRIDPQRKRIGLSLRRALAPEEGDELIEDFERRQAELEASAEPEPETPRLAVEADAGPEETAPAEPADEEQEQELAAQAGAAREAANRETGT